MPSLRKYVRGSGWYVIERVYDGSFRTWQIEALGLAWLRERGVAHDRDEISIGELRYLQERGWVSVKGEGRGTAPAIPVPAGETDWSPVIAQLIAWAECGGMAELDGILHPSGQDHRRECFSPEFVRWLAALDRQQGLSWLESSSYFDFDEAAYPRCDRLPNALHRQLARRKVLKVLWQLAVWVGRVARLAAIGMPWPDEWGSRYPTLHRLFAVVGDALKKLDGNTDRLRPEPPRSPRMKLIPPRVVWDFDYQQVVAVLPAQRFPGDAQPVWQVDSVYAPAPTYSYLFGAVRTDEVRSLPLRPQDDYTFLVTIKAGQPGRRFAVDLPPGGKPCVLFTLEGDLVVAAEGALIEPGEYLALAHV